MSLPATGAVYARIIRAALQGKGVRLSLEECYSVMSDGSARSSAIDAASDDPPDWLTPAERQRRALEPGSSALAVFEPTRQRSAHGGPEPLKSMGSLVDLAPRGDHPWHSTGWDCLCGAALFAKRQNGGNFDGDDLVCLECGEVSELLEAEPHSGALGKLDGGPDYPHGRLTHAALERLRALLAETAGGAS